MLGERPGLTRRVGPLVDRVAQGDAGELALPLEFFESPGPLGLVEPLGRGLYQLVEPFELGGQFAEAGSFAWCEPPILAGGQFVEQATAQVFLERPPRLGWLTEPGQHRGQGGAPWLGRSGAVQAGESDPEPGRIQTLHGTQPSVSCLDVTPLGVEIVRHVGVAVGGRRVFVAE